MVSVQDFSAQGTQTMAAGEESVFSRMSNYKTPMPNEVQNSNVKKPYDLEERTAQFGENIIDFAKSLTKDRVNAELIRQIIRSGTGIGANYAEADAAESKRDFRHKIALCKKESKETKYWLRMLARANPSRKNDCARSWNEAQELTLIFSSIILSSRKR